MACVVTLERMRSRCDSSDCLICQGQQQAGWCATHSAGPGHRPQGRLARKRSLSQDGSCQLDSQEDPQGVHALHRSNEWMFLDADRERTAPAPACITEVLQLGAPSQPVSHDLICALEFSPTGTLLATGSCAKQVRLYNLSQLIAGQDSTGPGRPSWQRRGTPSTYRSHQTSQQASSEDISLSADEDDTTGEEGDPSLLAQGPGEAWLSADTAWLPISQGNSGRRVRRRSNSGEGGSGSAVPTAVHRLPSKVSCLAWSPTLDGVICVGDYDGVITQLHMATGHQLREMDGHGGHRIWGLAHSHHQQHLWASGSEDGTARLWSGRSMETCAGVITPPALPRRWGSGSSSGAGSVGSGANRRLSRSYASICGVDFSAHHAHLLALACSDHAAYIYDIRASHTPLQVLLHHTRPVSYVKFFGADQLVTASTDGTLAIWDINGTAQPTPLPVYTAPLPGSSANGEGGSSFWAASAAPLGAANGHASGHVVNGWGGTAAVGTGAPQAPSLQAFVGQWAQQAGPQGLAGQPQQATAAAALHGSSASHHGRDDGDAKAAAVEAQMERSMQRCSLDEPAQEQPPRNGLAAGHAGVAHAECTSMPWSNLPQAALAGAQGSAGHAQQSTMGGGAQGLKPGGPWKVFRGHKNERSFVGLAVRPEDGLMACGSETSCVFTYHTAWSSPLACFDLGARWRDGNGFNAAHRRTPSLLGNGLTTPPVATWRQQQVMAPLLPAHPGRATPSPATSEGSKSAGRGTPGGMSRSGTSDLGGLEPSSSGQLGSTPFVSAVAWQTRAVSQTLGIPALLAAGSSAGDVRLLVLQRP